MSLSRSLRCALGFITMVAALGVLGGCQGDSTPATAEFPKVEKSKPADTKKATPPKGSDRVGSEAGTPNP